MLSMLSMGSRLRGNDGIKANEFFWRLLRATKGMKRCASVI